VSINSSLRRLSGDEIVYDCENENPHKKKAKMEKTVLINMLY
jgi:hypothetical protein